MWEKELEVAKCSAIEAGKAILKVYNEETNMPVEYKEDQSPLTTADKVSNQIILEALRSSFHHYAILSEEEKDFQERLKNDCCFIVDPLDGTKEFLKRNGEFTVNIALAYQHRAVMGVIYVPVTGELYYATQGQGAFKVAPGGNIIKLSVSDRTKLSSLRFVVSSSHGCRQMDEMIEKYRITNLIRVGSSLKGCMVASGEAEVYYRFNPTMEWDTAAMQCIAEEAGALCRQMDGKPLTYNRKDSCNANGFYIINHADNLLVE